MTCPEERLIAFLAGELPPDEERRFDEHLLSCEPCWRAVKADQAARLALEKLRQPAPACLVVIMAVGATGWLAARAAPSDPAEVAAVVAMMTPGSPPTTALRAGEHFVIAGQPLMVRAYQLEGTEELVATSARPFPMPSTSHLLPGSSSLAWMATKGRLSMYGVNQRGGGQSMFVVADMPMAEMPQLAARLDLI